MQPPEQDILSDVFARKQRRRALLPLWIKIFIWIYFVFSGITVIAFVAGLFGVNFKLEEFGLSTQDPTSVIAMILVAINFFKGVVSYALWNEKSYGVKFAIADAISSIVVCSAVMIYHFSNGDFSLRLELIPLYFYLVKMRRIRKEWESEYVLQEQLEDEVYAPANPTQ